MDIKEFLTELCQATGLNTAHDFEGIKTEMDINIYSEAVVKKIWDLRSIIKDKNKIKNTLEEANDIIFNRAEEKQREYGPIDESLSDTATVASIISNKEIDIEMVYAVLMGLKISRMRWNKKHDTFLDSIGYTAAYEAYLRKIEKQNSHE